MPRHDFSPPTGYVIGGVRTGLVGSMHFEERTWAALEEVAWQDRTSKQRVIEELVVAYLRDRFPSRVIPTREEIRYGDVAPMDDEDPEDDQEREPAEGIRHLEHDEIAWRRGSRRAVG